MDIWSVRNVPPVPSLNQARRICRIACVGMDLGTQMVLVINVSSPLFLNTQATHHALFVLVGMKEKLYRVSNCLYGKRMHVLHAWLENMKSIILVFFAGQIQILLKFQHHAHAMWGIFQKNASSCDPCPPGMRGTTSGCVVCPAGTFSSAPASTTCTTCPQNATSTVRSTSIANCTCNAGFVKQDNACHTCTPGKFTQNNVCVGCGAGHYYPPILPPYAHNLCQKCPANSSSNDGAFTIHACNCNIGFLKEDTLCKACPANNYCPDQSSVISCPVNTKSTTHSYQISQCICDPGYFGTAPNCDRCFGRSFLSRQRCFTRMSWQFFNTNIGQT